MKSTSSFTVLPDFGLYCSSTSYFMMRVGGQSGTAIVSVFRLGAASATSFFAASRSALLVSGRAS